MIRAALLLAAVLALLLGGASAGASPSGCADGRDAPVWSPTGKWIAWGTGKGICFARSNGKDQQLLRLTAVDPPYELVWAKPNLLVGLSNYTVYSIAFRPTPHLLPPGEAFYGSAGDTFSLDANADVLATAFDNFHQGAPVTIMRPGGATTTVGDRDALNEDASLAPDGKHLVWVRDSPDTGGDVGPPQGIVRASIDGTHVQRLTGKGGAPVWSPSGREIAYIYKKLYVMTASGDHRTTVARDARPLAWSPNGRLLAYANPVDGGGDRLVIYDLRTKHKRRVKGIRLAGGVAWAPNSKELLVVAGPDSVLWRLDSALWRVPVRQGKPRVVVDADYCSTCP